MTLAIPTDSIRVEGPPQGHWTYADWEALPDDEYLYEVIDGALYVSTSPSFFHQWVVRRFDCFVGVPAEEQGLGFASVAPIGVIMPGCEPVQPDFVFVLKEHASIIHDRRIRGVPDLMVEVMSLGSITYDTETKLKAYAQAGVPEYAIISPRERQLILYSLVKDGKYSEPRIYHAADTVAFSCLPTIPLVVSNLFDGAPDTSL